MIVDEAEMLGQLAVRDTASCGGSGQQGAVYTAGSNAARKANT